MSIRVAVAKTADEKQLLAKVALEEELYHPGWMLKQELVNIERGLNVHCVDISLARKDGVAVGVSIYFIPNTAPSDANSPFEPKAVICFVNPDHRREGIGTKLIKSFGVSPAEMLSYRGEFGSMEFWTQTGTNYQGFF